MVENKKLEKSQASYRSHNLIMENREKLSVSGVMHVESFNEDHVILETDMGMLEIRGEELHITKLNLDNNSGELSIEGSMNACEYFEDDHQQKGSGFFSRIFK